MKILVINCGSSTLEFQLIDADNDTTPNHERRLAHGIADRIGGRARSSPRLRAKLQLKTGLNRFEATVTDCGHRYSITVESARRPARQSDGRDACRVTYLL